MDSKKEKEFTLTNLWKCLKGFFIRSSSTGEFLPSNTSFFERHGFLIVCFLMGLVWSSVIQIATGIDSYSIPKILLYSTIWVGIGKVFKMSRREPVRGEEW